MGYLILSLVLIVMLYVLIELRIGMRYRKDYPLRQAQKAARGRGFRDETSK